MSKPVHTLTDTQCMYDGYFKHVFESWMSFQFIVNLYVTRK